MKQKTKFIVAIFVLFISSIFYAWPPNPNKLGAATGGAGTQATASTISALSQLSSATTEAQINSATQLFLDQYSLVISTDCVSDSGFTCVSLTDADITEHKKMTLEFIEEWSKYPTAWTMATNLVKINFVKTYVVSGLNQARAAAPQTYLQTMLYDISYSGSEDYMRAVIHHEYGHYVEYDRSGSFYAADSVWASYNPDGFAYGSGGSSCYSGPCPTGEHVVVGFATGYGTSSIEEDKAEVYAHLFWTPGYANMLEWNLADTGLSKKTTNYKNYIKSVVPTMDEVYFSKIHKYYNVQHGIANTKPVLIILAGDNSTTNYNTDIDTYTIDGKAGDVSVDSGGTLNGTGTVKNVNVLSGGHVAPGRSPGCLNTNNLTFLSGSSYEFEVGGIVECIEYDQIKVTGTVTLGNGTLNVTIFNGFKPVKNQPYKIIDNDASDNVSGTFNNLAEGATFNVLGSVLKISYVGGDGNDVVLTVLSVPTTPDTGFRLTLNNPLTILIATTVLGGGILLIAMKHKITSKQ